MEEYVDIGLIFVGIGIMVFMFIVSWLLYQLSRGFEFSGNYEERISAFEIATLNKIADKKGMNLDKEIEKQRYLKRKHNFRAGIRKEMYEEMFGKDKELTEKSK